MRLLDVNEVNHVSGGCLLTLSLISYLNNGDGWNGAVQLFTNDFSKILNNMFELGTPSVQ